jgi:hypothetical protein
MKTLDDVLAGSSRSSHAAPSHRRRAGTSAGATRLMRMENQPAAAEASTSFPRGVARTRSDTRSDPCDAREWTVLQGIRTSGAAEAEAVAALLEQCWAAAVDRSERDAITSRFEAALASRQHHDNAFTAFGLDLLRPMLERLRWAALSAGMPSAAAVAALTQLLRDGSWRQIAAALPALAPLLPSLRNFAQFDQLLLSLPAALRDSLAALHTWVRQADDALLPPLRMDPLTAMAVAALLWEVQKALPRPQVPLQGAAGLITNLPRYWRRLAALDQMAGALLSPVAIARPWPRLTHVRDVPAGSAPAAPLPREAAAAPPALTSGASRAGENFLIALGSGMVAGGVAMIYSGWRMMWGTREPPPAIAADVVALLDGIVDIDAGATVWQRIQACADDAAVGDADAQVDCVRERLVANDLVEPVLAHAGTDPLAAVRQAGPVRRRRAVNDHDVRPVPRPAMSRRESEQQQQLRTVSRKLLTAARRLPGTPADPEALVAGNQDKVSEATARMYLDRWMDRHAGNDTVKRQKALTHAVRELGRSDERLAQVSQWLPQMDQHISVQLVQRIRSVTNNTVVPSGIYRNIFEEYPLWQDWEAAQTTLDPALFPLYRPFKDGRVRWKLVSSHNAIKVAGMGAKGKETDNRRAALYYDGMARTTHFPAEECTLVTLDQLNAAIGDHDFIDGYRQRFDDFLAACRRNGTQPERDAYVEAIRSRLSGTATLMRAMGPLNGDGDWLLRTLLRYPARFGLQPLGRDLALPGQLIRVDTLLTRLPDGSDVRLWGLVLAESQPSPERPDGAVLIIAPSRLPLVEQFVSREDALRSVTGELDDQLHTWVAVGDHARLRGGNGAVVTGPGVDDDLLQHLFLDQLTLRSEQLRYSINATGLAVGEARRQYLDLDRRLLALPPPVPMPMLTAAHERLSTDLADPYAVSGAHWLAKITPRALLMMRNADRHDAQWLSWLGTTRSLVIGAFPALAPYVADSLEQAVLTRYGKVMDATEWWLVRFSGGTASAESPSGFVHDAAQKVRACTLVECAFNKARDYPDGTPGSASLGIYSSIDTATFDQDTELGELLPGEFVSTVRSLDLRTDYLAALDGFWTRHRNNVVLTLRGVYMFSAWQQFAEGSLSVRGLQMALATTGFMSRQMAENPAFQCRMTDGVRASWVSLYGKVSTLLRIEHQQWRQVLLYAPGDNVAFREFSDAAQANSWLTRVANTDRGRSWLEGAFDLADLQDGWFSNGLDSSLDKAHGDIFQGNQTALAINGTDVFNAIATRMQTRTRNDAESVLASNGETLAHNVLQRLMLPAAALNLACLVFPELLPVAILADVAQGFLGAEEAINAPTQQEREQGAESSAWGAAGLLMDGAAFGLGRTSRLVTEEGKRVVPAVQAVTETAADPLKTLSARYAQPAELVVDGARPADNGVYHYAGRHYIRQAGHTYEVVFDKGNRTWRLKNPDPGNLYQNPVRLNADGRWEPHSDVGLRGGAPDKLDTVSRNSLDAGSSYRGALMSEMQRSTQSLDSAGADFRWGMTHWERVVLPMEAREDASIRQLEGLFVSGKLSTVQRGALSVIIAKLERNSRINRAILMEEAVYDSVERNGGHLYVLSQLEAPGRMGYCTGWSRLMAVALYRNREIEFIGNLRRAMRLPDQGVGAEMMSYVRDAQGAELLRGATSAPVRMGYDEIAPFLKTLDGDAQFFLTSPKHSMLVGRRGRMFFHLDANTGMTIFYSGTKFGKWLRELFSSRYFSSLQRVSSEHRGETLAELYGADRASEHEPATLFMIRQIDLAKLDQQARERGWDRMLENIPD